MTQRNTERARAGSLHTTRPALPPGWVGSAAARRWARLRPDQQARVWAALQEPEALTVLPAPAPAPTPTPLRLMSQRPPRRELPRAA